MRFDLVVQKTFSPIKLEKELLAIEQMGSSEKTALYSAMEEWDEVAREIPTASMKCQSASNIN